MTELTLVDDLMLLLLDDDGASVQAASTLPYVLGGAVLTELALRERVEIDETRPGPLSGPIVVTRGDGPLGDDLLQDAWNTVAEKERRVQPLLLKLGGRLRQPVLDRLETRGLIRRESGRVLGVFRTTKWPAAEATHEAELREGIRSVLEDGAEPDARMAALIGLLSGSGALRSLRPKLPTSKVIAKRAKALEQGEWGPAAVNEAVTRAAASVAAATVAATVSASTAAIVASS